MNTAPTKCTAVTRMESLSNWEVGARTRMKPELAPMVDLMLRLDNPHRRFRAIHVTGSKGKGSVCALLEAAIHSAGWRVGRYASPHLECINERVIVRRNPIAMDALEKAIETVLAARDEASLSGTAAADATWFDVMTAAAFLCFSRQSLDWVIVEVGLGGRLDSTNVVDGAIAVITNIGLEHTDVLGPTITHIAFEKAGIIKPGASVVTGVSPDSPAFEVVQAAAYQADAHLIPVPCDLPGVSERNLALVRSVLDEMGARGETIRNTQQLFSAELLSDSLVRSVQLPGRLERMILPAGKGRSRAVSVVFDGAHVPFSLDAVLAELQERPKVALLALSSDKDAAGMVECLASGVDRLVVVPLHNRACWAPRALADLAVHRGLPCEVFDSIASGVRACLKGCDPGTVLVTGSLHVITEARAAVAAWAEETA
ncbi:MAG: Mur ligase family protein [Burkholderiaceae bacterium]